MSASKTTGGGDSMYTAVENDVAIRLLPLALLRRLALEQRLRVQRFRAPPGAHRVTRGIHRDARVLAFRVDDVEVQAEAGIPLRVEQTLLDRIGLDAAERLESGVLRRQAAAHVLHDQVRSEVVEVGLAAAGGAGGADGVV